MGLGLISISSLSRISLPGSSPLLYYLQRNTNNFFPFNLGAYFFIKFVYFLFISICFLFEKTYFLLYLFYLFKHRVRNSILHETLRKRGAIKRRI